MQQPKGGKKTEECTQDNVDYTQISWIMHLPNHSWSATAVEQDKTNNIVSYIFMPIIGANPLSPVV